MLTPEQLHYQIIRSLLDEGACPSNAALATRLGISPDELEQALQGLDAQHGVVLHPHVCAPWVIHPFSLAPTLNWVQGPRQGWWAPCIWCALGVATLAQGEVQIHTRIGAEQEPLILTIRNGEPVGHDNLVVHFAIPPRQAWNNVHSHCQMVLPFHSAADVAPWCERHQLPLGQPLPLHQVATLARLWYGSHSSPDWRKWSMAEAQAIFAAAGLTGPFWDLGPTTGRF